MRQQNSYTRFTLSFALSVVVVTVFTFQSFAAPEYSLDTDPSFAQDCSGMLTVKDGKVTINGNAAQTGATVMSGSIIATNSDGEAIIDLGAVGRVEIGENTTVTLTCAGTSLEVKSDCSRIDVEVNTGTLEVKEPKVETLTAGKKVTYGGNFSANSTGGIIVKVECEGRKPVGLYIGPGLLGLLALIGVGAAVAVGVKLGEGDIVPTTSPIT